MIRVSSIMLAMSLALVLYLHPSIIHAQSYDIAVTGILVPAETMQAGGSVTPRAALLNAGPDEAPPSNLTFTIRGAGGAIVYGPVAVFVDGLPPGQPVQIPSSQAWSPQAASYQVTVVIDAEGDASRANDTARRSVTVLPKILTRAEAIAIVDTGVIAKSEYATSLAAFLYNRVSADSLLHPGARVMARDSSFSDTITNDSYLFWLDNKPGQEWFHPSTFAIVDARSGGLTLHEAESWPVVNNEEITRFTEQGNLSLELFRGSYPSDTGRIEVNSVSTTNKDDWAIVVVGANLDGEREETARRNDAARIIECLNRVALGPRVDGGNIKVVPGDDYRGATLKAVCDSLDSMKGKACRKLFFHYIGHGGRGHMIVKKEGGGTENFTYKQLACKLLELGVPEVCITIEACHSGSAIPIISDKDTTINGNKVKLRGTVVTSSTTGNTTTREPDGASFIKAMNTCCKDTSADLNRDGMVTIVEAVAWARARNQIVARDNPQGKVLGDGRDIRFHPPVSDGFQNGQDGGGTLHYELSAVYYRIVKRPNTRERDSIVCRQSLYVENRSRDAHNGEHEMEVTCTNERDETRVIRELGRIRLGGRQRICLMDIPNDCKRVNVRRKRGITIEERDRFERRTLASLLDDSSGVSLERRAAFYNSGALIFQEIATDPDSSRAYTGTVEPIPGWGLTFYPPLFISAPGINTDMVVRGVMSDTATQGGLIKAVVFGADPLDTAEIAITALLFDTLAGAMPNGTYRYRAIDHHGSLAVASGTLRLESSLRNVMVDGVDHVDRGGTLELDHSAIIADSGVRYRFLVQGRLESDNGSIVSAANGLELESPASVAITNGSVLLSGGDGLRMKGGQEGTIIDFLLIDESAGNGLHCDSVPMALLRHVRILNSGASDLALRAGSTIMMLDCSFDDGKVSVENGSRLTRAWTTYFRLIDRNRSGVRGAAIELLDALGAVVARDTTDADGMTRGMQLLQYVQEGSARSAHTPHQLRIRLSGGDTIVAHDALLETVREIELSPSLIGAVEETPGLAGGITLSQNYPNPFGGRDRTTIIPFTLSHAASVTIVVSDPLGRELLQRDLGPLDAGAHTTSIDAGDLPAGAYIYELRTRLHRARRTMVVVE